MKIGVTQNKVFKKKSAAKFGALKYKLPKQKPGPAEGWQKKGIGLKGGRERNEEWTVKKAFYISTPDNRGD